MDDNLPSPVQGVLCELRAAEALVTREAKARNHPLWLDFEDFMSCYCQETQGGESWEHAICMDQTDLANYSWQAIEPWWVCFISGAAAMRRYQENA